MGIFKLWRDDKFDQHITEVDGVVIGNHAEINKPNGEVEHVPRWGVRHGYYKAREGAEQARDINK